jgi:hypothetical protein
MNPQQFFIIFCSLLSLHSIAAHADSQSAIVGHYVYEDYQISFSSGIKVDLTSMGIRSTDVHIYPDGVMVSRSTQSNGEVEIAKGTMTGLQLEDGRGSWVEHWPEVGYPVRQQVWRQGDGFRFSARFDDPADPLFYGAVTTGNLRRVGPVDPTLIELATVGKRKPPTSADEKAEAMVAMNTNMVPSVTEETKRVAAAIASQVRIEPVAQPTGTIESSAFFDEVDLRALGCDVPDGTGRYVDAAAPSVPGMRVFGLIHSDGCVIDLLNIIQPTEGGGPGGDGGLWAGLRASISGQARRREFDTERFEGDLGDYSEIRIFTQDSAYRGFWYAIETDRVLYVLQVFSPDLGFDMALDKRLRLKLAQAGE